MRTQVLLLTESEEERGGAWHGDAIVSTIPGELGTGAPVMRRGKSDASQTERSDAHL